MNRLVIGSGASDQLSGGYSDDRIYGNSSYDDLRGDEGDDIIYGGNGDDWIYGNGKSVGLIDKALFDWQFYIRNLRSQSRNF